MRRQPGITLVELVVFIVIVSIAFSALLLAFNQFVGHSADPLIRKQALAIAEALLEEIELMPFTVCDPDDANASTATIPAGCASLVEAIGKETGESRGSATTPFDNVNDYDTYSMPAPPGIIDISGGVVPGLEKYSATVAVVAADLGSITAGSGAALRIKVTVTPPSGSAVVLEGYRARYAPTTAQ